MSRTRCCRRWASPTLAHSMRAVAECGVEPCLFRRRGGKHVARSWRRFRPGGPGGAHPMDFQHLRRLGRSCGGASIFWLPARRTAEGTGSFDSSLRCCRVRARALVFADRPAGALSTSLVSPGRNSTIATALAAAVSVASWVAPGLRRGIRIASCASRAEAAPRSRASRWSTASACSELRVGFHPRISPFGLIAAVAAADLRTSSHGTSTYSLTPRSSKRRIVLSFFVGPT